jgi:very-short-patch-repair endonuclease
MAGIQLPYDADKREFSRNMRKEMTPPEKILWFSYLSKKKPAWRRQKII